MILIYCRVLVYSDCVMLTSNTLYPVSLVSLHYFLPIVNFQCHQSVISPGSDLFSKRSNFDVRDYKIEMLFLL